MPTNRILRTILEEFNNVETGWFKITLFMVHVIGTGTSYKTTIKSQCIMQMSSLICIMKFSSCTSINKLQIGSGFFKWFCYEPKWRTKDACNMQETSFYKTKFTVLRLRRMKFPFMICLVLRCSISCSCCVGYQHSIKMVSVRLVTFN